MTASIFWLALLNDDGAETRWEIGAERDEEKVADEEKAEKEEEGGKE